MVFAVKTFNKIIRFKILAIKYIVKNVPVTIDIWLGKVKVGNEGIIYLALIPLSMKFLKLEFLLFFKYSSNIFARIPSNETNNTLFELAFKIGKSNNMENIVYFRVILRKLCYIF
jgi:hypothetical protein